MVVSSKILFGGAVTNDPSARAVLNGNNQRTMENVSSTTSRVISGPANNGHYSLQVRVGAGSSPVGTLTVWYSNMPNPDPTLDDDWVEDTGLSIDLAVVANNIVLASEVLVEAIRVKVTMTSGTAQLAVLAKSEGE